MKFIVFSLVLALALPLSSQVTQPAQTGMVAPFATGAGEPEAFLTCGAPSLNLPFYNSTSGQTSFCNGTNWVRMGANVCRITTAITLSTSATTVCLWVLPANAVFAWSCNFGYAITAGTLPTVAIGMNASQAPVNETGYANIITSTGGGMVSGNASSTSSGNVNIKTGGSVINGTYNATTFGTIQGSATAGTFAITALLGGTTPAGTIPVGGSCTLW